MTPAAVPPVAHDGLPWPLVIAITLATFAALYLLAVALSCGHRRWERRRAPARLRAKYIPVQAQDTVPYERPAWTAGETTREE